MCLPGLNSGKCRQQNECPSTMFLVKLIAHNKLKKTTSINIILRSQNLSRPWHIPDTTLHPSALRLQANHQETTVFHNLPSLCLLGGTFVLHPCQHSLLSDTTRPWVPATSKTPPQQTNSDVENFFAKHVWSGRRTRTRPLLLASSSVRGPSITQELPGGGCQSEGGRGDYSSLSEIASAEQTQRINQPGGEDVQRSAAGSLKTHRDWVWLILLLFIASHFPKRLFHKRAVTPTWADQPLCLLLN